MIPIAPLIPLAKAVATQALGMAAKELVKVGVQEVGRSLSNAAVGHLGIGGDTRSILSALKISPESLGKEVCGVGGGDTGERVPLKDSKGEVRHHLTCQEAEHYEKIGLNPKEVNDRECLVRRDIDWERRDFYNQTNRERAEQGLAPLDGEGRPYELHHVQQRSDGMLAELTRAEHRGVGVDRLLHEPGKASEIDRGAFDQIRAAHWQTRAEEM